MPTHEHVTLIDQAHAHADLHPESREVIEALCERIEALHRTLRRLAGSRLWADDMTDPRGPR